MVAFAMVDNSKTSKGGEINNEDGGGPPVLPLFNGKIYIPSLEELQLAELDKIVKLWDQTSSEEFSETFPNLRTLQIASLPKLKHVWSDEPKEESHYFGSLENIAIGDCKEMESLFSSPTRANNPQLRRQKLISFPKLQSLVLMDLESFNCFFQGYSNMEFHALKTLKVSRLPLVKTLVKVGNGDPMGIETDQAKVETKAYGLVDDGEGSTKEESSDLKEDPERVEDYDITVDPVLFKGNVEFSSLEELKIKYMPELESIYETEEENDVACSSIFPKLKALHLTGGNRVVLKHLPEAMLHKLSSLVIRKFNELKCLVSSSVGDPDAFVKSLSELENLEELIVKKCKSLEELFKVVEGQDVRVMLSSLKKLHISGLPKLKCVEWRMLPNLQSLHIAAQTSLGGKRFLISATEVAAAGGLSFLQSLERLIITELNDMEAIIGDEEEKDHEFQKKDDREIVFPKLKEVRLRWMTSLHTFNSTSFAMRLPSLGSIVLNRCGLRSFSVGPMVIPQLSSLQVDYKTVVLEGDLNIVLHRQFVSNNQVARNWPQKVTSKLHEEHQLLLNKWLSYQCDGCGKQGRRYSYSCRNCNIDMHPYCALNESHLTEEPIEMKVGKDLPRVVNLQLHAEHELRLGAGRDYVCKGCHQVGELFAYYCEECDFYVHPKCAVEEPSPELKT